MLQQFAFLSLQLGKPLRINPKMINRIAPIAEIGKYLRSAGLFPLLRIGFPSNRETNARISAGRQLRARVNCCEESELVTVPCFVSRGLVIAYLEQEKQNIENKGGRGMLLYVGPDQIIPLSGILGTVAGLVMIFWGRVVQAFQKLTGPRSTKSEPPTDQGD